jgi:hypothetical protein
MGAIAVMRLDDRSKTAQQGRSRPHPIDGFDISIKWIEADLRPRDRKKPMILAENNDLRAASGGLRCGAALISPSRVHKFRHAPHRPSARRRRLAPCCHAPRNR